MTFWCATCSRLCSRLCSLKCCHLTAFCCRLSDATHEQCVAMCWHAEWWRGSENATSGLQSWQWRSACHVKKYTGPLRQQRKTERARQGTGLRRAGRTATVRQREIRGSRTNMQVHITRKKRMRDRNTDEQIGRQNDGKRQNESNEAIFKKQGGRQGTDR